MAEEVELNNLEWLIYKSRRADVVQQCQPLLDNLNFLLKWVEGDGQFARLHETKSRIAEVKNNVSFLQSFHKLREVFHQGLRLLFLQLVEEEIEEKKGPGGGA